MTTIREKWRQAEKLCDTKGWHCHPHAVTPCSHSTQGHCTSAWSPAAGSQGAVGSGCSQARFILWQIHHSHITFSSTFHHKLRVQILLSCSPTVVHSNTTLSILWWETSSPEPTVPLGNTKGRPRTGETDCWDSTGLVQKEKWRPN